MSTLLQINSSIFGGDGQSSKLAAAYTAEWQCRHPEGRVLQRDLGAVPVPHLDRERFDAFITPDAERSEQQRQADEYSRGLIRELEQADLLVLAVPMYNFMIPSTLHAWFDHVARAGLTFRYTETGPEGLLKDKQARVFITRGGVYGAAHTQTQYLREILGFIGIVDVQFVHAEGLALAQRENSLLAARQQIGNLLAA